MRPNPANDDGQLVAQLAVEETQTTGRGMHGNRTTKLSQAAETIAQIAARFEGHAAWPHKHAARALAAAHARIDAAMSAHAEGERQRARKAKRRDLLLLIAAAIERISGVHKGTKGEE